jgi:hypothetical protein
MAGEATRLRAPFAVVLFELMPEAADVVVTCGVVVDADVPLGGHCCSRRAQGFRATRPAPLPRATDA